MPLDDRKKKILEAIINDYILTAEPIGSRTIAKKYKLGISSATIRNEMADLEDMGFLEQPHTSAGRVPSDKGYRFYVNNIIEHYLKDIYLDDFYIFDEMFAEIDEIVKKYVRILSNITSHTIVAKMPKINQSTIARVQVIPVDSNKIILLVITDSGIIKNYLINLKESIDSNLFEFINNLLNSKVSGKNEREVNEKARNEIRSESGNARHIIDEITASIINVLKQINDTDLYYDGTSNILNFPEYKDLLKAKMFFDLVDNKELMNMIFEPNNNSLEVKIGSENKFKELEDLSVIKATYAINGETMGTFGIIGPTRMNYKKLINELNTFTKEISKVLTDIYKDSKR